MKKWLITLCLMPVLMVMACTNNETEYEQRTDLGITAAAFELIERGMTSDDLIVIIGPEIERREVEGEIEHIVWDTFDGGLRSISAIFNEDGYISSIFQFGLSREGEEPTDIKELYEQASYGMTYDEVRLIAGALPVNVFYGNRKIVTWAGNDEDGTFQTVTVMFADGVADDISFFSED